MIRSPFCLIQEDLLPNEWLVLCSCIMLNQTSRKQVDSVFREFVKRWNDPHEFLSASNDDIAAIISKLGFKNRRTRALKNMTEAFLHESWSVAKDLPGIGEYGFRCHEMMCRDNLGENPPRDHALVKYWNWRRLHGV